MKNLFFIYLAIISLGMITLTSCGDDENATDPDAPILTAGTTSAEVAVGTFATFDITGAVGKENLRSVTVAVDGLTASVSDVTWDGASIGNNPLLLFAPDTEGFTKTIGFLAPSTAGTSFTYTVTLTDEANLTDVVTFEVSTPEVTTTLDFEFDREPGSNFFSVSAATDKVIVRFNATQGPSPLSTISITRNSVLVDNADLLWPDASGTANNPYTLVDGEKTGLSEFSIAFQTPPSSGTTYSYTITLEDESGATSSLSLDVDRLEDLDGPFSGQFYHMAGATGCTGGYDLVNDADVSSSGSDADRDMLNTDTGGNAFTGSWEAQNATTYVKDNTGNLNLTSTKAAAMEIYDLGTPAASVASPVAGDIYVAKLRGGDDFAIIQIDSNDSTDNSCNMSTGNRGKISFTYYKG